MSTSAFNGRGCGGRLELLCVQDSGGCSSVAYQWVYYTSYEGPYLANQIHRKLGAFDRKLEGRYKSCTSYFTDYLKNI